MSLIGVGKVVNTTMIDDKRQIQEIYQRINEAMVHKEIETLNHIFEDNHKFVHMSGYKQSKQEWLKQIQSDDMKYFKTMPQKTTITIHDHTATLICDIKIDARIYGTRNTWSMKVKMYFEKRGEQWFPVNASESTSL